jgi:hypothetical protein
VTINSYPRPMTLLWKRDPAARSSFEVTWLHSGSLVVFVFMNLWILENWTFGLGILPSGYVKIASENGHRNSGFSHWKWWFSIVFYKRLPKIEPNSVNPNLARSAWMPKSWCIRLHWTKTNRMYQNNSANINIYIYVYM